MTDTTTTDARREEVFAEIRERRGFLLPLHELMGNLDPEILSAYNSLAGSLLFGPEPKALDLKTRFLVLLGVTTAVKGDREGVEWSIRGARKHGATDDEISEAMLLAGLPAGMPAVEYAAHAWQEMDKGRGIVETDD